MCDIYDLTFKTGCCMLILGKKMSRVKFSGPFDEIIKDWELLHYGKCAIKRFFSETLQVKLLLSYHGNRIRIFGIK